MAVDLKLAPKAKRPAGERCCEPVAYPDVGHDAAERMAAVAKALGDPVRLQLVDVLRRHAGNVCVAGAFAGALTETEYRQALDAAGLIAVEIRGTHRVHEHAAAAIIRASKPSA